MIQINLLIMSFTAEFDLTHWSVLVITLYAMPCMITKIIWIKSVIAISLCSIVLTYMYTVHSSFVASSVSYHGWLTLSSTAAVIVNNSVINNMQQDDEKVTGILTISSFFFKNNKQMYICIQVCSMQLVFESYLNYMHTAQLIPKFLIKDFPTYATVYKNVCVQNKLRCLLHIC